MSYIYQLLQERNNLETIPFVAIHESNGTLLKQVDALQSKCELAEREVAALQHQLQQELSAAVLAGSSPNRTTAAAAAAALKNEARLRDKLEKLQEELNARLKAESDEKANALKTAKELSDMKDLNTSQEKTIENLKEENERSERLIEHLTNEVNDAKSRTKLAEQQYEGLKTTIRSLQDENDKLEKERRKMEERLIGEKTKTVEEMNTMTEMIEKLKAEVDMLRTLKIHDEKRARGWFGGSSTTNLEENSNEKKESLERSRKFGNFGVSLPSAIKQTISAHSMEGTCVKYDEAGTDLLATASSDSTVKLWDTGTGTVRATFRGSSGHSLIGCDISGALVAGAGSDKTCRIWNLRTERMVCQPLYGSVLFD